MTAPIGQISDDNMPPRLPGQLREIERRREGRPTARPEDTYDSVDTRPDPATGGGAV